MCVSRCFFLCLCVNHAGICVHNDTVPSQEMGQCIHEQPRLESSIRQEGKQVRASKWCRPILLCCSRATLRPRPLSLLLITTASPTGIWTNEQTDTAKRAGQRTLRQNSAVSKGFVLLLMMPILENLVGVYFRCLLVSLPQTIPHRIREPVMDGLIKVKDNEWVLFIGLGLCGLWQIKK